MFVNKNFDWSVCLFCLTNGLLLEKLFSITRITTEKMNFCDTKHPLEILPFS